ncbi:MAG: host attachment protein [Gammaproteobacteria bacterium]|nr:host attachment protein [Gammaproteobacteria bacterium]
MNHYCVIVADRARARFFCLDPAAVPELESGPNLVEIRDLINPEASLPGRETWSETRSGCNMARGGSAHGYDDHRDSHEEEFNRRFARRIAAGAHELLRQYRPRRLVLAASSHMLGLLRGALTLPAGSNIEVREAGKDLTHMPPLEIQRHLAGAGLMPGRGRVMAM